MQDCSLKAHLMRQGRPLCSRRDPVKEARDWLASLRILTSDKKVAVLGFGAGFHVRILQSEFPFLEVGILEFDEQIQHQNPSFNFRSFQDLVNDSQIDMFLPFRPCWVGFEAKYQKSLMSLTQRQQLLNSEDWSSEEALILKELIK